MCVYYNIFEWIFLMQKLGQKRSCIPSGLMNLIKKSSVFTFRLIRSTIMPPSWRIFWPLSLVIQYRGEKTLSKSKGWNEMHKKVGKIFLSKSKQKSNDFRQKNICVYLILFAKSSHSYVPLTFSKFTKMLTCSLCGASPCVKWNKGAIRVLNLYHGFTVWTMYSI